MSDCVVRNALSSLKGKKISDVEIIQGYQVRIWLGKTKFIDVPFDRLYDWNGDRFEDDIS